MSLLLLDRPVARPLGPGQVADIVDEISRRRFLSGLAALGVLGGCAEGGDGAQAGAAPTPTAPGRVISDDRGDHRFDQIPTRIVTTGEESTELLVALGLQPVGAGSSRVDATKGDAAFTDYYLTPSQLGSPKYVGIGPFNLEAITALDPDLIIHYGADENVGPLEKVAPTVIYDVTVPGAWQEALRRLGAGLGREQQATAAIEAYEAALAAARERLVPVIAKVPRISVIYPNYRGGADNFVFGRDFALAELISALGFALVGIEKTTPDFPGVGSLATERLGDIDADAIIALSPIDLTKTASGPVLSALGTPVLWVPIDDRAPASGPLTNTAYLTRYADALAQKFGV